MVCQVCDGTGYLGNRNVMCPECKGTGDLKSRFLVTRKSSFELEAFLALSPNPDYRLVSVVYKEQDMSYVLVWELKD